MPIHTDVLADQIDKLATEVRESNRQFHDFRVEVARELSAIRVELAQDLGVIRSDMREQQATTRSALKVAAWGVGVLAPIIASLIAFAIWAAFHAGKLDSRVGTLEAKNVQAAIVAPKR